MVRKKGMKGLNFTKKGKECSEGNWGCALTDHGTVPQGLSRAGCW